MRRSYLLILLLCFVAPWGHLAAEINNDDDNASDPGSDNAESNAEGSDASGQPFVSSASIQKLLNETKSQDVFCRKTEGKLDAEVVSTTWFEEILMITVYDGEAHEHVMYFIHKNVLANHILFQSMYLKPLPRLSMTEFIDFDPAVNKSGKNKQFPKIQSIRSVDIPRDTPEYEIGHPKAIVITYQGNNNFMHVFILKKGKDAGVLMLELPIEGNKGYMTQQAFVYQPEHTGLQFFKSEQGWLMNDVEEYDAKVWPSGPVNRVGSIKGKDGYRFFLFMPVDFNIPKSHKLDFKPLTGDHLSGFIEPTSKRVVLFSGSGYDTQQVIMIDDMMIGARHNMPFFANYYQFTLRNFFTCNPTPAHPIEQGVAWKGPHRQKMVATLFYGIIFMAVLILLYALYRAITWYKFFQ